MAYAGNTFLQLRGQLAERLNDAGKVFSTDAELKLHIQDAIRFWNILTGDNKVNYNLAISPGTIWYDLFTSGFMGTRITTTGGTRLAKWRFFGNIPFGNVIHVTGTFYNIGTKPVVIGVEQGTNNITGPPVAILPNTSASINITVNSVNASNDYVIAVQNTADPVDVVAISPFMEDATAAPGVNKIDAASLQFQGNWLPGLGTVNGTFLNFIVPSSSPIFCFLQDQDIYTRITYAILEPPSNVASLQTAQFAQDEIIQSVQRKRDEFIFRTGCRSSIENIPVTPNTATVALPQTVIQVRRGYWLPAAGGTANPLFKLDQYGIAAYQPSAPGTPGQPIGFSAGAEPPLVAEIMPPPAQDGVVEFITNESQAALSAASATTILIPSDFVPGLMWGALADLLSFNLLAKDIPRAQIAQQRFEELMSLMQVYPFVFSAKVNGASVFCDAVEKLDIYQPAWRVTASNPNFVALSGNNLIAFPSAQAMNITLLMLANANVPVNDNDAVQLGDEIIDVVLDEAQATASFKMGGEEAMSAHQLHGNIIRLAAKRNAKVRAMACFRDILYFRTQREREVVPLEVNYGDDSM